MKCSLQQVQRIHLSLEHLSTIEKKQKKTSNASGAATTKQRGNRKGKGAAVDPRKRKSPEHTQQMVAAEEGTADNDNAKLSRKMPPRTYSANEEDFACFQRN
jgi:hypothetical protein